MKSDVPKGMPFGTIGSDLEPPPSGGFFLQNFKIRTTSFLNLSSINKSASFVCIFDILYERSSS